MKQEFVKAILHGYMIIEQRYETEKGVYTIRIVRYSDSEYFIKYLNDRVVECCNLRKAKVFKKMKGEGL